MKISYEWLKDYVEIDKTPEQLAKDLSLFGHEVEAVEKVGNDYILDFEITPNRGDCLSILGIAREISALYNVPLKSQKLSILRSIDKSDRIDKNLEVKIEKPEICPRFTARIIDNIKIGESPKWMQARLATYGFRPINNIVDITNYVMVATGQPLHAFDYAKIKDGLMNIRQAKNGEEVITLDGKNHNLSEGTIIIEDDEKIYDLAGIMGGIKSEVDEKTKTIVLQGAIFDPILIRKASKYLSHITDASYRYERGVDFEGTITGVDMAAGLIKESCPHAKIGELIDKEVKRPVANEIALDTSKVNKLLGTDISENDGKDHLVRLGFKINDNIVSVPSYRAYDIKIWQDVAEEIARMYGYNNLNKNKILKIKDQKDNLEFIKKEYIKDILKNLGFTEIYSYSFIDKKQANILGIDTKDLIEIEKPLSEETQYLRPSLLSSLLSAIAKNPWAPEVNIFEIGAVFNKDEKIQLGLISVGKNSDLIKSALKELGEDSEIKSVEQKILDNYKIRRQVNYVIIDFDLLQTETATYSEDISQNKYKPISKYAPTVQDLAFIVESEINSEKIMKEIGKIDERILLVELFDEYISEKFGKNKKNVAFHIWLQEQDKPMADEESNKILKNIISVVSQQFGGKLRSEKFK